MNHFIVGGETMTREERTAQWSAIIGQQAASGMSGAAWCRENHININPAGFYSWHRKLNEQQTRGGFIELRPASTGKSGTGIRIRLSAKLSIDVEPGFDPFTLRAVVAALSESDLHRCLP